jgi:hypothetical protein
MQYLLDANALITAHNTWYGLNRVPEFWKWLVYHGGMNALKMPAEIYAEVETGTDALAAWMKESSNKKTLLLNEATDPAKVRMVLAKYGNTLSAAAVGHHNRVVVTAEVSKSSKKGANRHIPDVCNDCSVAWMHPIEFIAALDFSTDWDDIEKLL